MNEQQLAVKRVDENNLIDIDTFQSRLEVLTYPVSIMLEHFGLTKEEYEGFINYEFPFPRALYSRMMKWMLEGICLGANYETDEERVKLELQLNRHWNWLDVVETPLIEPDEKVFSRLL